MEEKKKPSDIIREQGKEPPEFGKNSDVKAKKKKQDTVKDIEKNEKQAELKRIWNAIHEIKSLLSKTCSKPSRMRIFEKKRSVIGHTSASLFIPTILNFC